MADLACGWFDCLDVEPGENTSVWRANLYLRFGLSGRISAIDGVLPAETALLADPVAACRSGPDGGGGGCSWGGAWLAWRTGGGPAHPDGLLRIDLDGIPAALRT